MEAHTLEAIDSPCSDNITGRYYNCIFCKRGFSSAQALGGHMNIHRKDRAKMRQQSTQKDQTGQDSLHWYNTHNSLPRSSFHSFSSFNTSEARAFVDHHEYYGSRSKRLFGENQDLKRKGEEEEGGLDLELRLGGTYF